MRKAIQKQPMKVLDKKVVLKNFAMFTGKQLYSKKTPTQVFS